VTPAPKPQPSLLGIHLLKQGQRLDLLAALRSLRRHARLVDYHIHDGPGATTWLDFTVTANGTVHAAAPLNAGQTAELESIGVASQPGERILIASIAPEVVGKLSELPWMSTFLWPKSGGPL
jgi:hypothetical protein